MTGPPVVSGASSAGVTTGSPAVSVVIATYNRPAALRHAIESVRAGTFTDWELIVVGDACTDDTAECVSAFADPRIRFVNLAERSGYQSGPNNHGVALARGRYIAFLNHDDLYLPDHLAVCVAELERGSADLVWVPVMAVRPPAADALGDVPFRFELSGVPPKPEYWPSSFYFASSWVFRRELADRVGPWPSPEGVYILPSQAWLFEAWRAGARMQFVPHVGVVAIPAGYWPHSYGRREAIEHDALVDWMRREPRWRELMLQQAALSEAMGRLDEHFNPRWRTLRRLVVRPLYNFLLWRGIHPQAVTTARRYRRGEQVRLHRRSSKAE